MKSSLSPDLQQLPGVKHIEMAPGIFAIEVTTDHFQATIALQGGQLLSFVQEGQAPLLYLSPATVFAPGVPIRGGIPVCWPWFGPHPDDTSKPIHGFARNRDWALASVDRHDDRFHVKLSGPRQDGLSVEIAYDLSARGIACSLTTRNESTRPQTVSMALHTYLAISAAAAVEVNGLTGCTYDDKVEHRRECFAEESLRIDREIDRVFYTAAPITLVDNGWKRRITVTPSGSGSGVVWNPWRARSQAIADLPDDAWDHFVCIEPANALDDARVLQSGETHTLKTVIESSAA